MRAILVLSLCFALLILPTGEQPALAYVEIPYTLSRIIAEATNIMVLRVEKVDKEKNLIVYRKVEDIKGKWPQDVVKHNIGRGGFHPREWQITMEWAEPGKTAIFFHNGGASETCIHNYWYQAYPGGEWWNFSHSEPYFLRSFAGKPEKLATIVRQMLAGQEVIVPCMVDGNKMDIQLRTAKIQRLKASMKITEYNAKRDFVGWGGNDDLRTIQGMPGFATFGTVGRVDPEAAGVQAVDYDADGKVDLALFGEGRSMLLQNGGSAFNETGLPGVQGSRTMAFLDFNQDGKVDLLVATPGGPRVFANIGGGNFRDETETVQAKVPLALQSANWIDFDQDGFPDILVSTNYHGVRLLRNIGNPPPEMAPKFDYTKWSHIGPFDNTKEKGFATPYPPEKEINLKAKYAGKQNKEIEWKEADFPDGQVNDLAIYGDNENSVAYLYREIEAPAATEIPLSFGSDDTLTVWLNGQKVISENTQRGAMADQNIVNAKLKAGKNQLLVKICNGTGEFAFYFKQNLPKKPLPPRFVDVTDELGSVASELSQLRVLSMTPIDANMDKRTDLLLVTATGPVLLLNTAEGLKLVRDTGLATPASRISPFVGDYNGDGFPDVLVSFGNTCKLYQNDGKGRFVDASKMLDLSRVSGQIASACLADFDGDGRPDIFLGVLRGPNRYLRNDGNGRFVDSTESIGLEQKIFNTRVILATDLNKDGVPDLVMVNEGQESALLLGKPRQTASAR